MPASPNSRRAEHGVTATAISSPIKAFSNAVDLFDRQAHYARQVSGRQERGRGQHTIASAARDVLR